MPSSTAPQDQTAAQGTAGIQGDEWRFCIAPMLDWTDRHYRYLARLMTRRARLYTEMVTTGAILHGNAERHLAYSPQEHPVALQLGGSDPDDLARSALLAAEYGYDEINLNVGCPSDRVQNGSFGACLMATPELVADCVSAMQDVVDIPVTVKSRIGIDRDDSYTAFAQFIDTVHARSDCTVFIVHARKAWLEGLSPKENREIPPLRRDFVHRIKHEHPELTVVLNGQLHDLPDIRQELEQVDGVMVGRAAYQHIDWLRWVDHELFDADSPVPTRRAVIDGYLNYMAERINEGTPLHILCKPLLTLFNGLPGARKFRRHLSEQAPRRSADIEVVREAIEMIPEAAFEAVSGDLSARL